MCRRRYRRFAPLCDHGLALKLRAPPCKGSRCCGPLAVLPKDSAVRRHSDGPISAKQIKDRIRCSSSSGGCPAVNLFLLVAHFLRPPGRVISLSRTRLELDSARAEYEVCSTRYPVLLVHGIFFRDWQYVNYWGRIPAVLIRNGARVFYGRQQSALSVPDSAQEVRRAIEEVLAETGAEKVNIIAHSKGGLDSRYAISCLGMDKYVATLTTINTPHKGCDMVDFLLGKGPREIVDIIETGTTGYSPSWETPPRTSLQESGT